MDTKIYNGDFQLGETGMPRGIFENEETMQQVLFRLCINRGAFAHDKNLGSRLSSLKSMPAQRLKQTATAYVVEALREMRNIEVINVDVNVNNVSGVIEGVSVKVKNGDMYGNVEVGV